MATLFLSNLSEKEALSYYELALNILYMMYYVTSSVKQLLCVRN